MTESRNVDDPSARPVAVVTGASGGVGRATAVELAARGWDVALLARGRAGLEGAAADVRARGGAALVVPTDVADADAVEAAAERVEAELGEIALWVNNAMTTAFVPVSDLAPDEVRRATEVTYLGQVHGAMSALRRMRARDRGTIVFVGSALAYRGIPLQAAYCAAKFAVRGFYESLRTELIHDGSAVRVTTIHLPAVNTTQFGWCRTREGQHPQPVAPIYQPELVAASIADVAEDAPRQKILGTWNWMVVQLAQLLPGVGDHYMARTGVGGQLTDIDIDERPGNLVRPVDDDVDHRSHGIFDQRAHGALTPSFLASLPRQLVTFAAAARDRVEEVAPGRTLRRSLRQLTRRLPSARST